MKGKGSKSATTCTFGFCWGCLLYVWISPRDYSTHPSFPHVGARSSTRLSARFFAITNPGTTSDNWKIPSACQLQIQDDPSCHFQLFVHLCQAHSNKVQHFLSGSGRFEDLPRLHSNIWSEIVQSKDSASTQQVLFRKNCAISQFWLLNFMVFFWLLCQTEASSPLPLCFLPFCHRKKSGHVDIVTLLWLRHGSHLDTLRPCQFLLLSVNCLKTSVGALSWKVPENLPKCLHLKSKFGGPVYTWTSGNVSFKLKGCSCDKKQEELAMLALSVHC
jgi:hypothetical protein